MTAVSVERVPSPDLGLRSWVALGHGRGFWRRTISRAELGDGTGDNPLYHPASCQGYSSSRRTTARRTVFTSSWARRKRW